MSFDVMKDQKKFNKALSDWLNKYSDGVRTLQSGTAVTVVACVVIIAIIIWLLVEFFQLQTTIDRFLHLLLAIISSPLYVVWHYLNNL